MTMLQVFLSVFIFLAGVLIVFVALKKSKFLQKLSLEIEIGGVIYGGVVAVYSILLAFVVVIVWEQYQATGDRVQLEASKTFNLYRSSFGFPDSTGGKVRHAIRDYIQSLYVDEWPAMERDTLSLVTKEKYNALWKSIYDIRPKDDYEKIWYQSMVGGINDFGDARLLRISDIEASIPDIMWYILIFGGIITLLFAALFKGKNHRLHFVKILIFALLIVMNWVLIYLLDHPYKGILKIQPNAFETILHEYSRKPHPTALPAQ